jgi:hypothetical protein
MHDSTDLPVREQTGIRGDSATLFVSLELSRSTWVATSLAPGSKKMSKHTLVGGGRARRCCGSAFSTRTAFADCCLARGHQL